MREIVDRLVQDRIYKWNNEDYEAIVKTYQGTVAESVVRTEMHGSEFGLVPFKLTDSLDKVMEQLEPDTEDCMISYFGTEFPVSKREMCVLKALAAFQISKSDMLSETVSDIFAQLLPQIAQRKEVYTIEPSYDYGDMQKKLHAMVSNYVLQYIGRKQEEYVVEE